jgi:hypothetical protein
MNFVLVRPFDDKDIVELIAVQHPKKILAMFQRNWDDALAKAKKADPEAWNVEDVFETLEGQGWTIMKLDTLTVEY